MSGYPADTEVPWFRSRVKCAKCGGRGNKIDVRPLSGRIMKPKQPHGPPMTLRQRARNRQICMSALIYIKLTRCVMSKMDNKSFDIADLGYPIL